MADLEKANSESDAVAEEDTESAVPPDCQVIFFNDDYTTKDFVVEVLVSVFHKLETDALNLMESVHRSGSAVIGVYTYDIAATRAGITVRRAREAGFPLRVEVKQI
jgi:ATP-dependent Clp protease adaptor protein ClpS